MEKIEGPYKMPEPSLSEKVDQLLELQAVNVAKEKKKEKGFRMPFKGKLGNVKLKQGYVTVIEIAENDAIDFRKEQIVEGTIKLNDTFHSVDDTDLLTYKGKPLVIVPKKSKYPYNPNNVKNTTFSQKHIMSRMMNETIGTAKKIGLAGMSVGAIILIAIVAYALIAG